MKTNQFVWSVHFFVPLMFILSFVLQYSAAVVLVPVGLTVAVAVLITDAIRKNVHTRGQMFKLFCDELLVMRFGQLYENEVLVVLGAVLALIGVLILIVSFSMEECSDEA